MTQSGIITPKKEPVGIRCGYCPKVIWKDEEVNGRLFLKDSKPICVTCRVMKGKFATKIRKSRMALETDLKEREAFMRTREARRILDLASDTQTASQTTITK